MKKMFKKWEKLMVGVLVVVSFVSHGFNMFGYPYYENDEGNYMAQAWSLTEIGELAPYTYWYDHAPLGWIIISAWVKLTGGYFTFGPSVNSGRVIMLLLHVLTTVLLYVFAKRITGKREIGFMAGLIYSFSPLAIYYQRRVLLDNIMTLWVFASAAILAKKKLKLSKVALAAILFGFSILSKEIAVVIFPLLLLLIYQNTNIHNRKFALVEFVVVSISVVSLYFLYAAIKGELIPSEGKVSLLSTLIWHSGRGLGLKFWEVGSDFYLGVIDWLNKDLVMVLAGAICLVFGILISFFKKEFRIPTIFALLFLGFLARGSLVIGFYVVPLVPIFALLIAQVVQFMIEKFSFKNNLVYFISIWVVSFTIPYLLFIQDTNIYTKNETKPQVDALVYVKENLNSESYIAIDNYMYVDLKEPGFVNEKVFPNADWFWKIEQDPEVFKDKYGEDLRKIEYVVLSHEMLKQIKDGNMDYLKSSLSDSTEIKRWITDTTSFLDFENYISTNGDWMSIYKRKSLEDIYLSDSWNSFKSNFIHSYGQVIDPANNVTTSEGQSYGMLRSVWMGDKNTFEGVWNWTRDHLQYRVGDKLISWLWGVEQDKLIDSNSASDADLDIALALVLASKKFNDPRYLDDAKQLLQSIWEKEVVSVNGRYLLLSAPHAGKVGEHLVNPSYFSPSHYRLFAKLDPTKDWNKLAEDSYYFLDLFSKRAGNETKLPPNWIVVTERGPLLSASEYISSDADAYGYDAFRVFWRIALDYKWHNSQNAKNYLINTSEFLSEQWKNKTKINAIYTSNGTPLVSYEDFAPSSGALSLFMVVKPDEAASLFDKTFSEIVYSKDSIDLNYYNDNWAWFSIGLYFDKLPNLLSN